MSDVLRAAYDAAPYDSKPITTTNVDNLSTIARFRGIDAAPPGRCRVLELGCASGGNLIAMAYRFPDSTFIGVDLSPIQVDVGREAIASLGLTNITLEARSILDLDSTLGEFDYIICHGVYSWVPPEVQEGILRVCSERLAPNGVAYVSYNTYPGWHARMMVRQIMLSNDDHSLPPMERVARARAYLRHIRSLARPATQHLANLDLEIEVLDGQPDSQIFHEHLEAFNDPVLVSEFIRRSERHGLDYVGDARIFVSRWPDPNDPVAPTSAEVMKREQDLDFSVGQAFRRTVLARKGARSTPIPPAEFVRDLVIVMAAIEVVGTPDDPAEVAAGARVYRAEDGARLATSNPVILGALALLDKARPVGVPTRVLIEALRRQFEGDDVWTPEIEASIAQLPTTLMHMARAGIVIFQSLPSAFTMRLSEKPVASPLARWLTKNGTFIADMRHAAVILPPLALFLLPLIDGTRDRGELAAEIDRAVGDGRLRVPTRPDAAQLEHIVNETLYYLATSALLVA